MGGAERENHVEISPNVKVPEWGEWGAAQYCAAGAFARSVRVKIQASQGGGNNDDTGVNENGFVDKLDFKSSERHGDGLGENDNTGVDGLRWCCTVGYGWTQTLAGYTGSWGGPVWCPSGQAIYGFQTKTQDEGPDAKGMTAAKFFCAPV